MKEHGPRSPRLVNYVFTYDFTIYRVLSTTVVNNTNNYKHVHNTSVFADILHKSIKLSQVATLDLVTPSHNFTNCEPYNLLKPLFFHQKFRHITVVSTAS